MVSNLSSMFARVALLIVAFVAARSTYAGDVEQNHIDAGREQFTRVRELTTMNNASQTIDRYFNAQSCAECHKLGGIGGAGPNENNVQLMNSTVTPRRRQEDLEMVVDRFRRSAADREPTRASLARRGLAAEELEAAKDRFVPIGSNGVNMLHRRSTFPGYAETRLNELRRVDPDHPEVTGKPRDDGPELTVESRRRGIGTPLRSRSVGALEERNTPALFGLGLIAQIPQAALDGIAAGQPERMRGRSPRLQTGGRGRFGWKSQTATLAGFNDGACAAELGLRTPTFTPSERIRFRTRTPGDPPPQPLPSVSEVDMTAEDLAALSSFVAALPPPRLAYDFADERDVIEGETLFRTTGCAVCHVPDVGGVVGIYSDLLLHEVGTTGSVAYYGTPIGPTPPSFDIVRATEIRTPPLWGVADSAPYLHDGSAKTLEAAILRHTDQAEQSAKHFMNDLSDAERAKLLAFLGSLRAPEAAARAGTP